MLLPQYGQLMGVMRPVPRQRPQEGSPAWFFSTPRPLQSGQRVLRLPFQHAPQEILPVPSHLLQICIVLLLKEFVPARLRLPFRLETAGGRRFHGMLHTARAAVRSMRFPDRIVSLLLIKGLAICGKN